MDDAANENQRLRRTMRDLVALSALPAIWTGLGQEGIGRSLADALLGMLSLELAYVRFAGPTGQRPVEVIRTRQRLDDAQAAVVRAAIAPVLEGIGVEPPASIPNPFGQGSLQIAVTRFCIGEDMGVLITGARQADFPTEQDRLLLDLGANQTAIVLGRLGTEAVERQANDELARVTAESERQRRLYEAILSSTPDFVYVFSLDHRVIYANNSLVAMWGLPLSETIGKTFLEIGYEPWHAEMHCEEIDRVRATKMPIRGEVPFNGTNGRRIYDYIFVPVFGADGEVEAVAGTTRDVTERKSMEDELRHLAATLSDADRRKDEFLATLAHELRNPLAPIRNGLQILKLVKNDADATEQSRAMMERQVDQMVRLVDDLMDVSRISRGKIELRRERMPLVDVLASAVETSRPLIEQMEHELTITPPNEPVVVDADLTRLAQVFLNLLNNAAKYSDRGGRIWLKTERQGSDVVVSVRDTGIGIPAEQLPRIFEMFSQVDHSLERSQGGLGIGLTLVRQFVEMHGGSVEARSEGPGHGSEFVVRLPIVEDAGVARRASGEDAGKASMRILIVDDNRDGADSLAMMLKFTGNDTRTAYDGEYAVSVAAQFRPDVILMDIGMPRLNGNEACRRIRELPWERQPIIIAQTGWGQEGDRQRTQDAGFDFHLVKPVEVAALMKLLVGLKASDRIKEV
jgi:PAS domain S-box-containing protein